MDEGEDVITSGVGAKVAGDDSQDPRKTLRIKSRPLIKNFSLWHIYGIIIRLHHSSYELRFLHLTYNALHPRSRLVMRYYTITSLFLSRCNNMSRGAELDPAMAAYPGVFSNLSQTATAR